jgi:hypothetical protein
MQGRGTGTQVLRTLLEGAASDQNMTLAIVKTNPARQFYEKHGFRTTHEDEHKFYMSAAPMYFFRRDEMTLATVVKTC